MTCTRRHLLQALAALPWAGSGLTGCRGAGVSTHPGTAPRTPFEDLAYATAPRRSANIFLVAGGSDIANFAQEVVDQAQLWRALGAPSEAIACYYAKPSRSAFEADEEQYRRLLPALSGCRAADPAALRRDILEAAQRRPPFVYLYLTAHGLHSLLRTDESWRQLSRRDRLSAGEQRVLDQPLVSLDASAAATSSQADSSTDVDANRLVAAMRRGIPPQELLLTPAYLSQVLQSFPRTTRKIVVIQACFSGAFIGHGLGQLPRALHDLTEVPNIVAITATVAERPSFGCGPGQERTFFGEAFGQALASHVEQGQTPADVAWESVYEDTAATVRRWERREGEAPSLPGFFSNVDQGVEPAQPG